MFSACKTYEKQLGIEKTRLSHQVWSHRGSTFKKKRTLNGRFSRPAETDPYERMSNMWKSYVMLHPPFVNDIRTLHERMLIQGVNDDLNTT